MSPDRAIAERNWERPLDYSLLSTYQGELQTPFSRLVNPLNSTRSEMRFPLYAQLPAELQLRMIYFCDQPTMFQLMHTSRHMRAEAKKLFFSNVDTWYLVKAKWLLKGGYAGHTVHGIDFLTCVETLYVDFGWMTANTWLDRESLGCWLGNEEVTIAKSCGGMNKRMLAFWQTVQRRLPRVKHVILGDDHDRSDYHDGQLPPDVYMKVGQMCPSGISVSVDLVQGDGSTDCRMKRVRWQLITTKGDVSTYTSKEWALCSSRRGSIINPPKKVFRGPAGVFLAHFTRDYQISCQRRAVRIHRIAAMEKLHFDGLHQPFSCAAPDCYVKFAQPEEYTTHVIPTGHDKHHDLPEPFKTLFAKNDKRLERLSEIMVEKRESLLEWWGESGTEKRCVAEKGVVHQLEHDPLYTQDKPLVGENMREIMYACINEVI